MAVRHLESSSDCDLVRLARVFVVTAAAGGRMGRLPLAAARPATRSPGAARAACGFTSLRHWLRPVVRNYLTDIRRRLESRRDAEMGRGETRHRCPGKRGPSRRASLRGDSTSAVAKAIWDLGPRSREALLREHTFGQTDREIPRSAPASPRARPAGSGKKPAGNCGNSLCKMITDVSIFSRSPDRRRALSGFRGPPDRRPARGVGPGHPATGRRKMEGRNPPEPLWLSSLITPRPQFMPTCTPAERPEQSVHRAS